MRTPSPKAAAPVILGPDLVALLQDMGLTWDEVRIYQFLLNASSAISSAIVRETGHSRGRIYEALRRLVEKGVVREAPTRPIQFHPTPLAELLSAARARLTKQLAAVTASQELPLAVGDPDVAVPLLAPTKPRDVRVLSGRRACNAELSRMLEDASTFFWLTGGGHLVRRLAANRPFLTELKAACDRGIDVQLVLPHNGDNERDLADIEDAVGPGVLQRATADPFGPLISCATDQAAMEVISQPADDALNKGDDVAIQVSSELFADASRKRTQLAASLQARASEAPYQWLGPNHGSDLFLEAVRNARRDVLVLGPSEWSTYLAHEWPRNAGVYESAKKRGVMFRALTAAHSDTEADLDSFAHVWDIRIVHWHPVWLTIVDGRELFQAFTHPSLGGPPQFRQSRETNEIAFYQAVFDRLWAKSTPA